MRDKLIKYGIAGIAGIVIVTIISIMLFNVISCVSYPKRYDGQYEVCHYSEVILYWNKIKVDKSTVESNSTEAIRTCIETLRKADCRKEADNYETNHPVEKSNIPEIMMYRESLRKAEVKAVYNECMKDLKQ